MTETVALEMERRWLYSPRYNDQVVVVSGDDVYLCRYLGGAAASILLAGMRLHVNAVAPSAQMTAALERLVRRFPLAISLSVETNQLEGEQARAYFAASRFLCARELVSRYRCSVFILDVDSVVLRPFVFPDTDYGLFLRTTDDPRFQVAAGALFVAPSGLGLLDSFADAFAECRPWSWFDDQKCLTRAHQEMKACGLRAVRLTNRFLGFEPLPEIAVWSAKGRSKTADVRFVRTSMRLSETIWRAVGAGAPEWPAADDGLTIDERNAPALARRAALRSDDQPPMSLRLLLGLPPFVGFAKVRLSENVLFEMLLCDRDDGVALRAFWNGVHEPATSRIVAAFARASRCIIDVGAHTGYFSILAATANTKAAVLAVEPSSVNCARLLTNVRANGLTNVSLASCAASDRAGISSLVSDTPSGYHSSGGRLVDAGGFGEVVRTVRLDDLVDESFPSVGLIKCDVEGHEAAVLSGARTILERDRPCLIVERSATAELAESTAVLNGLNYRFFVIDEAASRLQPVRGLGSVHLADSDSEACRNCLATVLGDVELRTMLAGQMIVE